MKKVLALGLLIALCILTSPVWAAQISTEKTIYSPGETVIITGSGFTTDSQVEITITVTDPALVSDSWTVVSDDGTFQTSYYLSGYEGTFLISAIDSTGLSAEATFYDPQPINVDITLTLNAIVNPLIVGQTGVAFSGVVSNASSYPILDGITVQLQNSTDGTTFNTLTSVQTSGGTGSYGGTFTVPPPAGPQYYRAHCPGEGNLGGYKYNESKSSVQIITVNPNTPINSPPVVAVNYATVTFDEGQPAINNGTWSDTDGDSVTLTATNGTVITNLDGTWDWSFPTTDGPSDSQTITITATDEHGLTNTTSFELTVNNVAPTVTITGPPLDANVFQVGVPVTFTGSFIDPGADSPWTAVWSFDSLTTDGVVDQSLKEVTGSYTFTAAGIYSVKLTVTDKDGGSGEATTIGEYPAIVIIYDPNGGFVTGGGWIISPAGASSAYPDATGKANFGFVSKYKKGATTPEGETEFQFKAGNLNFHSSSYDWLVVAGAKAIYKGEGTINGAGNYGFMLSAIDGAKGLPDKFRIKIWDKDNADTIVYDNQVSGDTSDNADPTTAIAGGSIVVHK